MKPHIILSIIFLFSFISNAQVCNYADEVIDFSSQWSTTSWNAQQALGEFDTYPNYGDIATAWASRPTNQREFLELRFDNPSPINTIHIYETYNAGAVDIVSVKNPNTNNWEVVYTAAPIHITNSRILQITFPLTSFNVSEIRIDIDSASVPSWNEIDAVAINSINSDAGEDQILNCGSTTLTLGNNTCTTDDAIYFWTTPDGNIISGVNTKNAIVNLAGTYTLTVTKYGISMSDYVVVTNDILPLEPTGLECWEANIWDTTTCLWITSGTQPLEPTAIECWETNNWDTTTCSWITSGTQPLEPTGLECWEANNWDTTTCSWITSGSQPLEPTGLECWETNTWDITTCSWITSGTQPQPVDVLPNTIECDNYSLPTLTSGNYFTETGGTGTQLYAGDTITTIQTIFIYAKNGTCIDESEFNITIIPYSDFNLIDSNLDIALQDLNVNMDDTSLDYEYAVDGLNFQISNQFFNLSEGNHTLYVRDVNGCLEKSISFEIIIVTFKISKFFTPNNDGYNDFWKVSDNKNTIKSVHIFDRYGKLIKQINPNSQGWDGTFNGSPLKTNDYWYLILLHSGEQIKGHFTLKR